MADDVFGLYRQVPPKNAADFLGVTPRKLEQQRREGGGPPFVRLSHKIVRYRMKDLIEYQENAERRWSDFLGEYDSARKVGDSPIVARDKAHRLIEEEYHHKKYGERRLKDLLREHRPDDWPIG